MKVYIKKILEKEGFILWEADDGVAFYTQTDIPLHDMDNILNTILSDEYHAAKIEPRRKEILEKFKKEGIEIE